MTMGPQPSYFAGKPQNVGGQWMDFLGRPISEAVARQQLDLFESQQQSMQRPQAGGVQMDSGGSILEIPAAGPVTEALPSPVPPLPGATTSPYYQIDPQAVQLATELSTKLKVAQMAGQAQKAVPGAIAESLLTNPFMTPAGRETFGGPLRGITGNRGQMGEVEDALERYRSGDVGPEEFLAEHAPGELEAIKEGQRMAEARVAQAERDAYANLAGATEGSGSLASGIAKVAGQTAKTVAEVSQEASRLITDAVRETVEDLERLDGELTDAFGAGQMGNYLKWAKTSSELMGMLGAKHGMDPTEYINPYTVGAMMNSYMQSGMTSEEARTKVETVFEVAGNDKTKQKFTMAWFTDPFTDLYQNLRGGTAGEALVEPAAVEAVEVEPLSILTQAYSGGYA